MDTLRPDGLSPPGVCVCVCVCVYKYVNEKENGGDTRDDIYRVCVYIYICVYIYVCVYYIP
jgi:hypothetical protein